MIDAEYKKRTPIFHRRLSNKYSAAVKRYSGHRHSTCHSPWFAAVNSMLAACLLTVSSISGAAPAPAQLSSPGAKIYAQQCAACHQVNGEGIAAAFPPLKNHAGKVFLAQGGMGGRTYLSHVLLYGLTGPITVDGKDYNGNMPAWGGQLNNQQIADVLNYVLTSFGNNTHLPADFRPYTAAEIQAEAGKGISGKDVLQSRQALKGLHTGNASNVTTPAAATSEAAVEKVIPKPIYVAEQNSGNIGVLPAGQAWPGVEGAHYDALSPDGSKLLVSGFKTGNVYLLDTATGKIRGSVAVGGLIQGVQITPDGHYGFAIAETQGVVAVIDLDKIKLLKKIPVGKTPHNAIFSRDGKFAYVTIQGEGKVAVIDMSTLTKTRDIPTPGLDTPHNLDLSDDGHFLWIRDFVGHVGILDLKKESIVKTFNVGKGHGGIDVVPGGKYVATGAIADSVVTVIDQSSRKIVANIKVGTGPHGVKASKDGRWIYAAVTADNTIAVIDSQTLKLVQQIPIKGKFPFWIAVPANP